MNNTVVLGGDNETVEQIDGELSLDITTAVVRLFETLDGEVGIEQYLDAGFSIVERCEGECGTFTKIREGAFPTYTGATEVTPTEEAQTLNTAETSVMGNIVIQPIPRNYGRITWNGSSIMVS